MNEISEVILNGVGKKTRIGFQKGTITERELIRIYSFNKKEADKVHLFGMTQGDLKELFNESRNPILKDRIKRLLCEKGQKAKKSGDQNKESLRKLQEFENSALGIGLKPIIHRLRRFSKFTQDENLIILSILIEAEYANLCAKRGRNSRRCYERKSYLIEKAASLAESLRWKYGYNNCSGKNASYIIYFYLPDGEQLSWHTNDYTVYERFPYLDVEWDGKVCSTLTKLISYLEANYSYLFQKLAVA